MPTTSVNAQGITRRRRPSNVQDGNEAVFRSGRYGEEMNLSLIPKNHLLADEGSYFVAQNPTPSTAIAAAANCDATHALPTIGGNTDLQPYFVVYNSASPSDPTAPRVYLDAFQLLVSNAGANGTSINFGSQIDSFVNRVTHGAAVGGTSINPVNPNGDDSSKSVVQMWAGANVVVGSSGGAGAGAGVRLLPKRQFRPVIPVVADVYCVTFGGSEQFVGSLISSGTGICQQSFNYPPVIIGPGQAWFGFLWGPSNTTAMQFEFDLSWWER